MRSWNHAVAEICRRLAAGRWPALPALGLTMLLAMSLHGTAAAAQGQDIRDWNRGGDTLANGLGLHAGKIGGTGLSFRVPLQWYLYAQFSGGIWHAGDDERHNLGMQLHYLLRQDRRVRVYTGLGAGMYHHRQKTGTAPAGDIFVTSNDWNYGAGVGIEVLQGTRWSWQIEFDFVHEQRTGDTKVSPQVGIYYYW